LVLLALLLSSHFAETMAQRRGGTAATAPAVTAVTVQEARVNERVSAVGSTFARQRVTVTTRVAGIVAEVLFEGGSKVEAGQALIRLEAEPERIAVETAEAQRAQAADAVARYQQLREGTVTRVARAEADTALKVADAALRRAREDLDRMTIQAPFSGIVGLSTLHPGDYLAIGTPIATLDDRSALIVEFTVPESVAPSIRKGQPVRANPIARSGQFFKGTVQAVGTRIDPVSRTLVVRAEIPNPDLSLIPGSTFSINIEIGGEAAAMVPGLAIQWDHQGAFVWRLTADNTVERVNVGILSRDGDRVLVDAALQPGERVVHEGGDTLRPGQAVRIISS
jgi:RND family efflux transporter MFP subunit